MPSSAFVHLLTSGYGHSPWNIVHDKQVDKFRVNSLTYGNMLVLMNQVQENPPPHVSSNQVGSNDHDLWCVLGCRAIVPSTKQKQMKYYIMARVLQSNRVWSLAWYLEAPRSVDMIYFFCCAGIARTASGLQFFPVIQHNFMSPETYAAWLFLTSWVLCPAANLDFKLQATARPIRAAREMSIFRFSSSVRSRKKNSKVFRNSFAYSGSWEGSNRVRSIRKLCQ